MSPERLLKHFDQISEAPDAISRLRRFILDLAVRGKLVEQDPADEPAADLLKRIDTQKSSLVKSGEMRKERAVPVKTEYSTPYHIPTSWRWSRLSEVGFVNPRNMADDNLPSSFVPMPMIAADFGVPNRHEVRTWGEIKSGFTHFAEGDVALAKITPCFENGKSTVFRSLTGGIGAGTTELHVLRPILINPDYILIYLKSPYYIESGIPRMTGTAGQKRVPTEYFAFSPFPLPPLPEQHRIVAKVDELMALCDELEAAQSKREKRRDRLVAATLHGLNNGGAEAENNDVPSFEENVRFFFNHLPHLTTRPEHIQQLRQTILNLAVRGMLVPQDPNDEPVSTLLNRIKGISTVNLPEFNRASTSEIGERYELPCGWEWLKGHILANFVDPQPSHRTPPMCPNGISYIGYSDIGSTGKIDFLNARKVSPTVFIEHQGRYKLKAGDFIIGKIGTIGQPFLLPEPFDYVLSANVILVQPFIDLVFPSYLIAFIQSPLAEKVLQKHKTDSTHAVFGIKKARELLVPLPPLAEQRRIVAKLDELIALCGDFEARLTTNKSTRCQLLKATFQESLGL
jgi:type I restriction enzyme S subunit